MKDSHRVIFTIVQYILNIFPLCRRLGELQTRYHRTRISGPSAFLWNELVVTGFLGLWSWIFFSSSPQWLDAWKSIDPSGKLSDKTRNAASIFNGVSRTDVHKKNNKQRALEQKVSTLFNFDLVKAPMVLFSPWWWVKTSQLWPAQIDSAVPSGSARQTVNVKPPCARDLRQRQRKRSGSAPLALAVSTCLTVRSTIR